MDIAKQRQRNVLFRSDATFKQIVFARPTKTKKQKEYTVQRSFVCGVPTVGFGIIKRRVDFRLPCEHHAEKTSGAKFNDLTSAFVATPPRVSCRRERVVHPFSRTPAVYARTRAILTYKANYLSLTAWRINIGVWLILKRNRVLYVFDWQKCDK